MADVEISYKGSTIASMSASGNKTLLTEGKYCEDDITVVYTSPGGGGSDPWKPATLTDGLVLVNGAADWDGNNNRPIVQYSSFSNRRAVFSADGETDVYGANNSSNLGKSPYHLIPIPSTATKVKVESDVGGQFAAREYVESGGAITSSVATTGWTNITANTPETVNLTSGTSYLTVMFRVNSSNSNYGYSTEPRKVNLDFE